MVSYSVEVCKELEKRLASCQLDRMAHKERYDPGDVLQYEIMPISAREQCIRVSLLIEAFVGGGFAGQVYKVRVLDVPETLTTLSVDQVYALKIFLPPSKLALFFRNLLYGIGFQGAFQMQTNPAAARAGALWQEFIRRAAALHFGDEKAVNRIHGTLVDSSLGSCGEISDWVEGRTWRLEVNDRIDLLHRWERGQLDGALVPGSPEYRSKKTFMKQFVDLLHDMGAHEFARQYEWSTWKSQPNVLKRVEMDDDHEGGLTAVDFRAGLTLLPFLPMSPGDFKLILQGMKRGALVQFDRGDLKQLEAFVKSKPDAFTDMMPLLEELKECERVYRNSTPDMTHHGLRIFFDRAHQDTFASSAVQGWRIENIVDHAAEKRLQTHRPFFLFFLLVGWIPLLGTVLRKAIGNADYRSHYMRMFRDFSYVRKAFLAKRIESLIRWHREGRLSAEKVEQVYRSVVLYIFHLFLSILPVGLHRFLSDRAYFLQTGYDVFIRPIRLYFDAALREEWLREMVQEGRRKQMINAEDAEEILLQVGDPYIHKYLQSLAVHICMSPITHIISGGLAVYYLLSHPEMPPAQAYLMAAGIIALFQVIPVSPGSFSRGLYVLYVATKERNFRDYRIALSLAFLKYVGYLAFPIQMTYRYPTLACFMAGFWATRTVRVVPVFGESGALLEHKIFSLFYNLPLTIRRKMSERALVRKLQRPRAWHALFVVVAFVALGVFIEYLYVAREGSLPGLGQFAPLLIAAGFLGGILVNLGSGGASSSQRILLAVGSGVGIGISIALISSGLMAQNVSMPLMVFSNAIWHSFIAGMFSAVGAMATEFKV